MWLRSGYTEKGRDGCRVPIPWTVEGPSYGFGSDGSWLPQPEGWGELSVEAQDGVAGSTLELYRTATRIRAELLTGDEAMRWHDSAEGTLVFERGSGVVVCINCSDAPMDLPPGEVLVSSVDVSDGVLPADAAAWVLPT